MHITAKANADGSNVLTQLLAFKGHSSMSWIERILRRFDEPVWTHRDLHEPSAAEDGAEDEQDHDDDDDRIQHNLSLLWVHVSKK